MAEFFWKALALDGDPAFNEVMRLANAANQTQPANARNKAMTKTQAIEIAANAIQPTNKKSDFIVEYDHARKGRTSMIFANHFSARRFFVTKLTQGKNPKVLRNTEKAKADAHVPPFCGHAWHSTAAHAIVAQHGSHFPVIETTVTATVEAALCFCFGD